MRSDKIVHFLYNRGVQLIVKNIKKTYGRNRTLHEVQGKKRHEFNNRSNDEKRPQGYERSVCEVRNQNVQDFGRENEVVLI